MPGFGEALRTLRVQNELRQIDVCDLLDGQIARSTLANIEAGRERPSARFLGLLRDKLPDWSRALTDHQPNSIDTTTVRAPSQRSAAFEESAWRPGGPFELESLSICYVFQHTRAPSEIIEVRRVRARRNGAHRYGLKFKHADLGGFDVDTELLWGGTMEVGEQRTSTGNVIYLHEVVFDRQLARGQVHEFATRTWIERDPEPGTAVTIDLTIPAREVSLHLAFLGPEAPRGYSVFGPIADTQLVPEEPGSAPRQPLPASRRVASYFANPLVGPVYGLAWEW